MEYVYLEVGGLRTAKLETPAGHDPPPYITLDTITGRQIKFALYSSDENISEPPC